MTSLKRGVNSWHVLNVKSKANHKVRSASLYDNVNRIEFLEAVYERCKLDGNLGRRGRELAEYVEQNGADRCVAELAEELRALRRIRLKVARKN